MKCISFILACYTNNYLPPPEFDYEPREPYQIVEVSTATVHAACHMDSLSCAKPSKHLIIISTELKGEFRAIILRHEKAHLNHWIHGPEDDKHVVAY